MYSHYYLHKIFIGILRCIYKNLLKYYYQLFIISMLSSNMYKAVQTAFSNRTNGDSEKDIK